MEKEEEGKHKMRKEEEKECKKKEEEECKMVRKVKSRRKWKKGK